MDFKVGDWFKEEWDEKAPEPGRAYYVIDNVEGGAVSLRRYAIFDKKPESNSWRKLQGVETEHIARRLKTPVTDAAEIARLKGMFESLPEALDPM
jgi:hypothetical protein